MSNDTRGGRSELEGDRLDELLHVGLTRATTKLVVIAPPALARRLS